MHGPGLDGAVDGLAQRLAQPLLGGAETQPAQGRDHLGGDVAAVELVGQRECVEADLLGLLVPPEHRQHVGVGGQHPGAGQRCRSSGVSRTASAEMAGGSSSVSIAVSATARAASSAPREVGDASSGRAASCSASSAAARSGWPLLLSASAVSTASRARSTSPSPAAPSPASSRSARSKCWAASSGPPTWAASWPAWMLALSAVFSSWASLAWRASSAAVPRARPSPMAAAYSGVQPDPLAGQQVVVDGLAEQGVTEGVVAVAGDQDVALDGRAQALVEGGVADVGRRRPAARG